MSRRSRTTTFRARVWNLSFGRSPAAAAQVEQEALVTSDLAELVGRVGPRGDRDGMRGHEELLLHGDQCVGFGLRQQAEEFRSGTVCPLWERSGPQPAHERSARQGSVRTLGGDSPDGSHEGLVRVPSLGVEVGEGSERRVTRLAFANSSR